MCNFILNTGKMCSRSSFSDYCHIHANIQDTKTIERLNLLMIELEDSSYKFESENVKLKKHIYNLEELLIEKDNRINSKSEQILIYQKNLKQFHIDNKTFLQSHIL